MDQPKSILVVGFNTRPLTYSLKNAGYDVYAVDFFGDLDLYPNVKDSFVLMKELGTNYSTIKTSYSELLTTFTIKMLKKHPNLDYLLIGSGMDDAIEERLLILNEIKKENYKIKNLNNEIKTIEKARDIKNVYDLLKFHGFDIPFSFSYQKLGMYKNLLHFPVIFKKFKSAGGINVYKISNLKDLSALIQDIESKAFNPSDWLIQEYIEGTPLSCTTISDGEKSEVISINRQIIGEKLLNPPREFSYCGNIVPAELPKNDENIISRVSKLLTKKLALKGINGFDYVLKDHYPYLMEINPRIPGSITASERSFNLNLINLHVKSFHMNQWSLVKRSLKSRKSTGFVTKLIYFAPKDIDKDSITKINNLENVHDKSEPNKNILKEDPICTVLYKANDFLESYNGAKKIIEKIKKIIG
ncbi:MAG: ATP-grasp domain-containing protein [Candidatus Thorarchaeota archaeon]